MKKMKVKNFPSKVNKGKSRWNLPVKRRQHSESCGKDAIIEFYSRFRPAELGVAGLLAIVLVFIDLLLIGCLVNCLKMTLQIIM